MILGKIYFHRISVLAFMTCKIERKHEVIGLINYYDATTVPLYGK